MIYLLEFEKEEFSFSKEFFSPRRAENDRFRHLLRPVLPPSIGILS